MIWNSDRECMSRSNLEALQLERLQHQVRRAYDRVPYYRQALEGRSLSPDDIGSLGDLRRLPFTRKADFRDQYPYGLFAVPRKEVARIHASSGTTGKPTVVAYTAEDLRNWGEMCARELVAAGVTDEDLVQISMGYGLFTGALGWHDACECVGAAVVPVSSGNTRRQLMLMEDLGTTVLVCTPSYAVYLAEQAAELGVDLRSFSLRVGIQGSEPWSEGMRREIEERLGLRSYDTYGLSEVVGPGVSAECEARCGMHVNEDHFLVEVIDPETEEPLPAGAKGELVLTTLSKEALPALRYRTGDITSLNVEPCSCGRTLARMDRVTGRTDDMLIVRGVNVFPSQVETVLLEIKGLRPHYLILVDREKGAMDELEIWVEVLPEVFTDEYGQLASLQEKAEGELAEVLGLKARVRLVEPGRIERSTGKAKRVVDRREL